MTAPIDVFTFKGCCLGDLSSVLVGTRLEVGGHDMLHGVKGIEPWYCHFTDLGNTVKLIDRQA